MRQIQIRLLQLLILFPLLCSVASADEDYNKAIFLVSTSSLQSKTGWYEYRGKMVARSATGQSMCIRPTSGASECGSIPYGMEKAAAFVKSQVASNKILVCGSNDYERAWHKRTEPDPTHWCNAFSADKGSFIVDTLNAPSLLTHWYKYRNTVVAFSANGQPMCIRPINGENYCKPAATVWDLKAFVSSQAAANKVLACSSADYVKAWHQVPNDPTHWCNAFPLAEKAARRTETLSFIVDTAAPSSPWYSYRNTMVALAANGQPMCIIEADGDKSCKVTKTIGDLATWVNTAVTANRVMVCGSDDYVSKYGPVPAQDLTHWCNAFASEALRVSADVRAATVVSVKSALTNDLSAQYGTGRQMLWFSIPDIGDQLGPMLIKNQCSANATSRVILRVRNVQTGWTEDLVLRVSKSRAGRSYEIECGNDALDGAPYRLSVQLDISDNPKLPSGSYEGVLRVDMNANDGIGSNFGNEQKVARIYFPVSVTRR